MKLDRCRQQKVRRQLKRAQENVLRIIAALLRLGVLPVTQTAQATDVARLKLLAAALRRQGVDEGGVIAVLTMDWAARAPDLTATVMATLRRRRSPANHSLTARLLTMYRPVNHPRHWRTFWHGPARLHTVAFRDEVPMTSLLALGTRLCRSRIRLASVLSFVQTLPRMGPYTSVALLRAVTAGAGRTLRDCNKPAAAMSAHTALLADTVPFHMASRTLRRLTGDPTYAHTLLAFFYCETIKILRHEGVLHPLGQYQGYAARFVEDLASKRCRCLAVSIQTLPRQPFEGDTETHYVNRVCPGARNMKHASTDVVRRWRLLKAAMF